MAFLRPSADDVDGNWLNESGNNTNLYASLDETTAGDTDYIVSPDNPVDEVCRIALSDPGGSLGEPFVLRYRFNNIGGTNLRVRLVQGASTEIASWTETVAGWTTSERTLTSPQFAAITDFNDMFVEFMAITRTLPFPMVDLVAWFEGDEFTGDANGTAIATWTDQKAAFDATQATSSQRPTVDATGLNSMAVVNFDQAFGQHLILPDVVSTVSAASVFFVCRNNDDYGSMGIIGAPVGYSGTASEADHWPYSGTIYHGFASSLRKVVGAAPMAYNSWHIGNLNSAPSDWSCFLNGTSFFSTASNTVAGNVAPRIGAGVHAWHGKIAEILLFKAVLGTSDRQKVEGYLAHRWGIAAVLDSGHPYKSSPP